MCRMAFIAAGCDAVFALMIRSSIYCRPFLRAKVMMIRPRMVRLTTAGRSKPPIQGGLGSAAGRCQAPPPVSAPPPAWLCCRCRSTAARRRWVPMVVDSAAELSA